MSVLSNLNSKKKFLIIGGDSNIGIELFSFLNLLNCDVSRTTRNHLLLDSSYIYLDLEKIESIDKIQTNYDFVIFCAAMTSVNKCEEIPSIAYDINYHNTFILAEKFIKNGCFTIFFSTSQVFSGINGIEKVQNTTNPITVYGKSKDLLEKKLLLYNKNVSIIRTTKIIFKKYNLFDSWVSTLESKKPIYPFNDIYFSPISIQYLLSAVTKIINEKIIGLNQISSKNDILYADAAYYIADKLKLDFNLIIPKSLIETNIKFCPKFTLLESNLFDTSNVPSSKSALDYYIFNKK
jgi:dTDP-4-dehydrorhamnose reductase